MVSVFIKTASVFLEAYLMIFTIVTVCHYLQTLEIGASVQHYYGSGSGDNSTFLLTIILKSLIPLIVTPCEPLFNRLNSMKSDHFEKYYGMGFEGSGKGKGKTWKSSGIPGLPNAPLEVPYTIDGAIINIFGLSFLFDPKSSSYSLVEKSCSALEIICLVESFFRYTEEINAKGYVTLDSLNHNFMTSFMWHLYSFGFKYHHLGNSELPYTLWYNFIFISLYSLIIKKIHDFKMKVPEFVNKIALDPNSEDWNEISDELDFLRVKLLARIDQYLKMQIQRRGITVIQNSYVGFDSEYETKDERKFQNRLLSVQSATQRRTIIKIPLYRALDISYVNPLSSELSNIFEQKVDNGNSYQYNFRCTIDIDVRNKLDKKKLDLNEISLLNKSLKISIDRLRKMLFSDLFDINASIIEDIKALKNLESFKECTFFEDLKRDQFVFSFPLTPLCTNLIYPSGGVFSFKDLLEMVKSSEKTSLTQFLRSKSPIFSRDEQSFSGVLNFTQTPIGGFVTPLESRISLAPSVVQKIDSLKYSSVNSFRGGSVLTNGEVLPDQREGLTDCNEGTTDFESGVTELDSGLDKDFDTFVKILLRYAPDFDSINLYEWYIKRKIKIRSRTKVIFNKDVTVSLTVVRNTFITAHYSAADLSMLSDFDVIKEKLSIVNKSFVTLGKPLRYEDTNVYIRDTVLLAPAGKQSLGDIGKMYESEGDFSKREISKDDLANMGAFLKRDRIAFEEYALQDAIITLKHVISMEVFNFRVLQIGVPLTLSSIGRKYVAKEWSRIFKKYLPYQISGEYLIGNPDEIQTPKGLFASGDIGTHLSYFIANYKGGRNESFMYGKDDNTHWIDYDLTSAYTTGMASLTLPDYYDGSLIKPEDLDSWTPEQFLRGYLIVNGDFKFPQTVKYPSIPCYVDKTSTVYPLEGTCYLTGPEYWLARQQGCVFEIKSAFYINPKTKSQFDPKTEKYVDVEMKPFHGIIKDIQAKRREYSKGTIDNLFYKEMGNSIYGNVVRGMSNKKSYDSLTGKTFRVTATDLSNPILASWITAFIRSVIGECLHNIQTLGGQVVSVTTDGFITDLTDLETKLLNLPVKDTLLLRKYRSLRTDLTDGKIPEALEIKSQGKGVISWTTRGQLGIEGNMIAATGFQRGGFEKRELLEIFAKTMASTNKVFEYTRKTLRSAKDIFNKGGHVTMTFKEQMFRLLHDNRRQMLEPEWIKSSKYADFSKILLDSIPLLNIKQCKTLRFISKFPITTPFNKNNTNRADTTYKTNIQIGVRNFIKVYYSSNEKFGLTGKEFRNVKDLITFINGHVSTKDIKISTSSISKLRNRKIIWHPVPKNIENIKFADYIKAHYPRFDTELFLTR
jgi:hypothetical protein